MGKVELIPFKTSAGEEMPQSRVMLNGRQVGWYMHGGSKAVVLIPGSGVTPDRYQELVKEIEAMDKEVAFVKDAPKMPTKAELDAAKP